jgi:hypothetical protein
MSQRCPICCLLIIFLVFYSLIQASPSLAAPVKVFTDPYTGHEIWQLTNGSQFEGPDYYTTPLFSPNGKYFVYHDANASPSRIGIMNTDGTNKRALGNVAGWGNPAFGWWTNDSAYYYTSRDLYRINPETNVTEQVPNAAASLPFYYPMISADDRTISGITNSSDTTSQGTLKFIRTDGTNYRSYPAPVQPSGTGFDVTHGWVGNTHAWYLNNSVNSQYRNIERVIDINTGQYAGTLNAVDPDGSTSWVGIFDHPIVSEEGYLNGGTLGLIAGFGSYWGMANTDFASGFNPTVRQLRSIVDAAAYPAFGSLASIQTQLSPNGQWALNYMVNGNCGVMALYPINKASSPFWLAAYQPASLCTQASYYGAYGTFSPDSTKVIFGSSYQLELGTTEGRNTAKSPAEPDIYFAIAKLPDTPTQPKVTASGGIISFTWTPAPNHREIKAYEVERSLSQNGPWIAMNTLPETYTYLDVPSQIGAFDTIITVDSTSAFPPSGVIEIFGLSSQRSTELVAYTGKTATAFTGCTRGAAGSLSAPHWNDAFVWLSTTNTGYTETNSSTAYFYRVRSVEWSGLKSTFTQAVGVYPVSATSTPASGKPGDFNNDTVVDYRDWSAFILHYGQTAAGFNLTGTALINLFDFNRLANLMFK